MSSQKKIFTFTLIIGCSAGVVRSQSRVHDALFTQSAVASLNVEPSLFQTRTYGDRKSVTQAVLLSLVLPGAGEYYAENYPSAKFSLMSEGGLWLLYAGLQNYGDWIRNDARAFATLHAGVNVGGQDEQFEVNLGNYTSTSAYNQQQLRDRTFGDMYTASAQQWSWDSDANRQGFRNMRIRSDEIHNYGKFVIAGLVINRLVSAFAAARSVNAFNRTLRANIDWQLEAKPFAGIQSTDGLELRLTAKF